MIIGIILLLAGILIGVNIGIKIKSEEYEKIIKNCYMSENTIERLEEIANKMEMK